MWLVITGCYLAVFSLTHCFRTVTDGLRNVYRICLMCLKIEYKRVNVPLLLVIRLLKAAMRAYTS